MYKEIERLKKSGKVILGCFPLYPPVELFHSLGLVPVVLWGLKEYIKTLHESDKHLQNYSCSVARYLTEFVLSDAGKQLDGLFMYNACDTLRNLPEILEYGMVNIGQPLHPFFKMHIPAAPPDQTDSEAYLKGQISDLIEDMERTFYVKFSGEKFKESIELYRNMRRLSKGLESLVAERKISFADFAGIIQMSSFLPVEEQIQLLESKLKEASTSVMRDGEQPNVGVVLSGILPPPPLVSDVIEKAGLTIVGNDIASCARSYAYTPETTNDPAAYYVDFYRNHYPCTTILYSSDRRIEELMKLIRAGAIRGFIFIGEKFCEYEYFEIPYLEKRFREEGLSVLRLEFSGEDAEHIDAYRTRIEAFSELLRQQPVS
jgi:benzoyl-CoA reductase/2-hydroxyglutaryl-CoA dehydratase subunit BcrC/BadD/HgdB